MSLLEPSLSKLRYIALEDIWEKSRVSSNDCGLVATWTTYLTRDLPQEMQNPLFTGTPSAAALAMQGENANSSEKIWKDVGFRAIGSSKYVGSSTDNSHPSKAISALDDYRRPCVLRRDQQHECRVYPYDGALARASDSVTLRKCLQDLPTNDPRWHAIGA